MSAPTAASFSDLLRAAVSEPGIISAAYQQFHEYSMGNQLLAWSQCLERKIPLGPIATFPRWQALGRQVRKGEKAIVLCMPITIKKREEGSEDGDTFTKFMYRPRWFVLSQTDGEDLAPADVPTWDATRALAALNVTEIPFAHVDGNCLGYARERSIAINPVNPMPHKTRFHELAHVVLGHTAEGEQHDSERTPRSLKECEAESVAMLCAAALGLGGVEESRGYIQSWWGTEAIPERNAQRILKAADQILKAGRVGVAESEVAS